MYIARVIDEYAITHLFTITTNKLINTFSNYSYASIFRRTHYAFSRN